MGSRRPIVAESVAPHSGKTAARSERSLPLPDWNLRRLGPFASTMAKPDSRTVASLLREYAHRSSLRGGNPYRTKAYLRAADSLTALSQPLDRIIAAGALTRIPDIGDAIADIVRKLYESGTHPRLEKLREEVPAGVMELFAYRGFGPTRY
ncbi:MAG: hypothetical protein E5X10_11075 [Mesorhizobium sp.]|nr:MAG: hypothetical protein E5X10_11075 [Mesorhizobium sp.]